jgi:hypothetical protein
MGVDARTAKALTPQKRQKPANLGGWPADGRRIVRYMDVNTKRHKVQRTALRSSRQLDYCTVRNLTAQIGHGPEDWPLVILKELLDNALDACDESDSPPEIRVVVNECGITVSDNGPGIPPDVVEDIIDFDNRVSTREAYASCDRGAQGQAWKTLMMMHYALTRAESSVEITARGLSHRITVRVDRIEQRVVVEHTVQDDPAAVAGTTVHIGWPNGPECGGNSPAKDDPDLEESHVSEANSSRLILANSKWRFLQVAEDFAVLNPHLNLTVDWHGDQADYPAVDTQWQKWRPSYPVSAHWLTPDRLERLVAGYIGHDQQNGHPRTVRELVGEFHGLAGTQKQKLVLDATGLSRTSLSALAKDGRLDSEKIAQVLAEMQRHTRPVKPTKLGVIGKDNIAARFDDLGCEMASYRYQLRKGYARGVPWLVEVAFAWNEDLDEQRLITGIHWSPTLGNPFRELGRGDEALDAVLEDLEIGSYDSVVLLVHLVHPGVSYSDQGKSAVLLGEWEVP